ncbi:hypothetical protein COO60DRAFT_939332 [Scenedesmus sp. NREL 46B-D3]|nr:hypothetical protein COO60DRAFT_939332 [Scenedesmus sp. NREL 46B-D3]
MCPAHSSRTCTAPHCARQLRFVPDKKWIEQHKPRVMWAPCEWVLCLLQTGHAHASHAKRYCASAEMQRHQQLRAVMTPLCVVLCAWPRCLTSQHAPAKTCNYSSSCYPTAMRNFALHQGNRTLLNTLQAKSCNLTYQHISITRREAGATSFIRRSSGASCQQSISTSQFNALSANFMRK